MLECTGKFLKTERLDGHFGRGAKRVSVVAPVKEASAGNIVVRVDDDARFRGNIGF